MVVFHFNRIILEKECTIQFPEVKVNEKESGKADIVGDSEESRISSGSDEGDVKYPNNYNLQLKRCKWLWEKIHSCNEGVHNF